MMEKYQRTALRLQVLKDVPALKPTQGANSGFQLGAPGGNNSNQANEDALKRAFGL